MTTAIAGAALARRVERAWAWAGAEGARCYGRTRSEAGAEVGAFGGGLAAYYGVGSPLSQAQGIGHDGPVADDELERLEAFYDERGAATAVEVASLADPGLLPTLSRRGYHVAEQTHVLIGPVAAAAGDAGPGRALTVGRVGDADRAVWGATVLRGFFEGVEGPPESISDVMEAMTAAPGSSGWLARVEGEPAGGAALLTHEGLALFAGDATLPPLRGRGVQTALILARLAEAARAGCDLSAACTQPGSASQRNYERHGFRVVYARTLMVREPGTGV